MSEYIEVAKAGNADLKTDWRSYSDYQKFYSSEVKFQRREFKKASEKKSSLLSLLAFAFLISTIAFSIIFYNGITGYAIFGEANSTSFSVEATHIGLRSAYTSFSDLNARDTLTYQQTGEFNATSETFSANIGWLELSNREPVIETVSISSSVTPIEGTFTYVNFSFIAFDENGRDNIFVSSATANFTRTGEAVRSAICVNVSNIDSNRVNFSCAIDMWYFDASGIWNVTVSIRDNANSVTQNSSATFNFDTLAAMVLFPDSVSFSSLSSDADNSTAEDFTTLNNTGNTNFSNARVKAFTLTGVIDSTFAIFAENFTVSNSTGGNPPIECGGNQLINNTPVNVTGVVLNKGNNTTGQGQQSIYYCIPKVPVLKRQSYSTKSTPWFIEVISALAAFSFSRKKKKGISKKILREIDELLNKRYGFGVKEVVSSLSESEEERKEILIPSSVFSSEGIGPAEIVVKYLKEEKGKRFSEIAEMLNRDDRTIWKEYSIAQKKRKKLNISESRISIPVSIFRERENSVLETVVLYLKEQRLANIEIARLLGKDPRNIYTIYSRAIKKLKASKDNQESKLL